MSARQPLPLGSTTVYGAIQIQQQIQLDLGEILRMPAEHQQRLKQEAGVSDKDYHSLSLDERVSPCGC